VRGMRSVAIVVAAALPLLGGACGGDSAEEGTSTPATTTAVATGSAQEIVGEWERETTCVELVQALRDAGMDELVDEFVAGNGFIPGVGVEDPEQIDVEQPCKGAVPRLHSHFFTEDGEFGSRDWTGEDVDDGRYRVIGEKLVISKEFPDVTFRYRIEGDTIMFDPLSIPVGCTTFRCGWSISVAHTGKSWKRVR
jgi:hypothetical protein